MSKNIATLDPVEGIWTQAFYTIAIIKDQKSGWFTGTIIRTTNPNWIAGQVKIKLQKTCNNEYETELFPQNIEFLLIF